MFQNGELNQVARGAIAEDYVMLRYTHICHLSYVAQKDKQCSTPVFRVESEKNRKDDNIMMSEFEFPERRDIRKGYIIMI